MITEATPSYKTQGYLVTVTYLLFPVFLLRRVVDVLVSVAASPATVPSGPANAPLPATLTKVSTDDMV